MLSNWCPSPLLRLRISYDLFYHYRQILIFFFQGNCIIKLFDCIVDFGSFHTIVKEMNGITTKIEHLLMARNLRSYRCTTACFDQMFIAIDPGRMQLSKIWSSPIQESIKNLSKSAMKFLIEAKPSQIALRRSPVTSCIYRKYFLKRCKITVQLTRKEKQRLVGNIIIHNAF